MNDDSKFLKNNSWDSLSISEVFFVECRSSGRCIRMNILGDYMYIYDLYLPTDQWVLIDQRVNDFLVQNVRVQ